MPPPTAATLVSFGSLIREIEVRHMTGAIYKLHDKFPAGASPGFARLPHVGVPINADFHGGKSINIFVPCEAHGYWETSEGLQ
jgi:hypothetical protein